MLLFNWNIAEIQFYMSLRYTTRQFDVCTVWSDHHYASSNRLSPYNVTILLTIFLMLYSISPWLASFITEWVSVIFPRPIHDVPNCRVSCFEWLNNYNYNSSKSPSIPHGDLINFLKILVKIYIIFVLMVEWGGCTWATFHPVSIYKYLFHWPY